jgi:Tol biopolymer transport system component
MRKFFMVFSLVLIPILISAQSNKAVYLVGSSEDICMNPVFSSDGKTIAYTKANYKGVWIIDLSDNTTKQITNEDAAGFGFKWSSDSKSLLSRVSKYENLRRYNAVKIFDVETKNSNQLTDYRTMMPYLPNWINGDTEVFLPTKEGIELYKTGKTQKIQNEALELGSYAKNNKIIVHDFKLNNDQIKIPIENADIINLTTSPDNKKVAFEVMGGNMYCMNIDGTDLVDLGKGNRPRWSFDSSKIIYMIAEDDGHTFTSSDIYSINADATEKRNLTNTNNLIEMNPCFSPNGKTIAFDVLDDGSIYIMNIE